MIYEVTRSILFYLDTEYRSGGTIGAPVFTFPNNLIGIRPQADESIRLTMQEAAISYTFYQTETFNNKFVVTEKVAGQAAVSRLVEIAIGNYNLSTFILELTSELNQNNLYSYAITFNSNTNTLAYVASPLNGEIRDTVIFDFNPETAFTATQTNIIESCNEIMGFPKESTITLSPVGGGLNVTSSIPITMSPGVENLYVTIRNQCGNFGNANEANVFTSSNILAKIPVAAPPYSTLYFFDLNNNFSTIITNKYLDNLSLSLFNERFTAIEPRKNWSCTIKIEIVRPKVEALTYQVMTEILELTRLKFLNKSKNGENEEKKNDII